MDAIGNKEQRIGVVAGSFDPITKGHLWIIEQASKMMDKVVVVASTNTNKDYMFSLADRISFITSATKHLSNIQVVGDTSNLLVNVAEAYGAQYIIKGVRNNEDFRYEKNMALINRRLGAENTIFLLPPPDLEVISSTIVKQIAHHNPSKEQLKLFVTDEVANALCNIDVEY